MSERPCLVEHVARMCRRCMPMSLTVCHGLCFCVGVRRWLWFRCNPPPPHTEAHAWALPKGSLAPQAAGTIHSDFERGFIRAETIAYEDYVACGSEAEAKANGKMRVEGKEYVVNDGDIFVFRYNV